MCLLEEQKKKKKKTISQAKTNTLERVKTNL